MYIRERTGIAACIPRLTNRFRVLGKFSIHFVAVSGRSSRRQLTAESGCRTSQPTWPNKEPGQDRRG